MVKWHVPRQTRRDDKHAAKEHNKLKEQITKHFGWEIDQLKKVIKVNDY